VPIKDIFKKVDEDKKDIQNLSIEDLKKELETNPDLLLLDIREIQERYSKNIEEVPNIWN